MNIESIRLVAQVIISTVLVIYFCIGFFIGMLTYRIEKIKAENMHREGFKETPEITNMNIFISIVMVVLWLPAMFLTRKSWMN